MSKVKRYALIDHLCTSHPMIRADTCGVWCLYQDYDTLRQERDLLRAIVEALEMESPQIKDEFTRHPLDWEGEEHPGPVKAAYDAWQREQRAKGDGNTPPDDFEGWWCGCCGAEAAKPTSTDDNHYALCISCGARLIWRADKEANNG